MARKKTVSISRKPSADTVISNGYEPPFTAGPMTLTLNLDSGHQDPLDRSESRATPSILAYGPLGLTVYSMVYCLSYGFTFSTILLGKCIPGGALIGQAWQDGTGAAQHNFRHE